PLVPYSVAFTSLCPLRSLHSFPTRRSSDLDEQAAQDGPVWIADAPQDDGGEHGQQEVPAQLGVYGPRHGVEDTAGGGQAARGQRSEEHTSELQSRENLVCRLLLEKKKIKST